MGVYDREYYREDERRGLHLTGPRSVTSTLIVINVAFFVVDLFTDGGLISRALALPADTLVHPLEYWRFLTYGFVHSPGYLLHIAFNMIGLYFFGPTLEDRLGRMEFLRFYLAAIVLSGIGWATATYLQERPGFAVGASGGVVAVLVLFCILYPHRTLLFMGIFPMPAWVLGLIVVAADLLGATNRAGGVAYECHLAGAVFAGLYYYLGLNFTRVIPSFLSVDKLRGLSRPKLRVHDPEADERQFTESVDAVLEKLSREGEGSLTRKERKLLEEASRRYQQKRR